ncbi:MAG: hypothetical protein NTV43_17165 [Methylococcales bacterium]|nr:hypothetical protein [Methylococcales bacterium]
MPRPPIINTLPDPVRSGIVAKLLAREPYLDISQWLLQTHGIALSHSALQRVGKPLQDNFAPLLALGMPIEEAAKNHRKIEEIGVEQVRKTLIDKLTENPSGLYAYLDKIEGKP